MTDPDKKAAPEKRCDRCSEALADSTGSQPMGIFPLEAPPVHCAGWCSRAHLPKDDGSTVHVSAEQIVAVMTAGERHEYYVSTESVNDLPAAVRLEGPTSAPMTPAQALELARALTAAAFAAVTGEQVTR